MRTRCARKVIDENNREFFQEAIMKKFSIKSVLVLVLALILVFSLVACNNDDGGDKGNDGKVEITAAEYFTKLWDLSKSMGNEKIETSQNVALSIDLGVEIQVKTGRSSITSDLAIGVAVDAVLDRQHTAENDANAGKDTALKVQLYNMLSGDNWVTLYYFMNDTGKIYIDFAGQNVVVPFDYMNDQHAAGLNGLIFGNKLFQKTDKETGDVTFEGYGVGELISLFTDKTGANWNLNTLVNDVLGLVETIMDMEAGEVQEFIVGLIGTFVPEEKLFDANGNINIAGALSDAYVGAIAFGKSEKSTTGTKTVYTTSISETVMSLVSGMAGDLLTNARLSLEFTEENNELDNFTIEAALDGIKNAAGQSPVVRVAINNLEFRGVDAGKSAEYISMPVEKDNYSTDVALDLNLALDLSGITISPSAFATGNHPNEHLTNVGDVALDGQIVVNVNGKLDIAGEVGSNNTAANAVISYKASGAETAVNFIEASFIGNKLAVKVNQELTVKVGTTNVSLAQLLVGGFGGYVYDSINSQMDASAFAEVFFAKDADGNLNDFALNPDFKGGVWDNMDVKWGVNEGISWVIDKITGSGDSNDTATDETPVDDANSAADEVAITTKIANVIRKALGLISTTEDALVLNVNNINEVVSNFGKEFNPEMSASGNINSIIAMDESNWLPDFANFFKIAGASYTKADADKKASAFLTEVMASAAQVTLKLNGTDGLALDVDVTINTSASVNVSLTLGLESATNKTYTDYGKDITATGNGWFYYAW